ncbi:DUF58 domain-containing protein [bacterium]|nr:DUF58 domain-containing protein [bacterium]
MKSSYKQYLNPETVSQLSRLDLIARLVVEGFITGLHRSPYHGFSVEFSEYRPYMPGDPLKIMDWKVLGRTERYFVKQYEEETNLKSYLILDASGSMNYSSQNITKFQYACYLSAALAYLMLLQRDAVGLITFDKKLRSYHPPRSIMSYLNVLLTEIDKSIPQGETQISTVFHDLAERIKRRGLVIVLSDLMDNPDHVLTALKHFRHRKHEVILFHILDPMERLFHFNTDSEFIDLENHEKIQTQPWHIREAYQNLIQEFQKRFKRECRQHRIDYIMMDTAQPFDTALLNYLTARKRIGG